MIKCNIKILFLCLCLMGCSDSNNVKKETSSMWIFHLSDRVVKMYFNSKNIFVEKPNYNTDDSYVVVAYIKNIKRKCMLIKTPSINQWNSDIYLIVKKAGKKSPYSKGDIFKIINTEPYYHEWLKKGKCVEVVFDKKTHKFLNVQSFKRGKIEKVSQKH